MKKILLSFLAAAVVIGGGAFYGGMKYGQSKASGDFRNLRNLSPTERQQGFQPTGAGGTGFGGNKMGSGLATGDIISKDEKSITIKLRDGGSQIVFYSDATEISKFISGTLGDLEIGQNVTVSGEANQTGIITAKSIQIRPAVAPIP